MRKILKTFRLNLFQHLSFYVIYLILSKDPFLLHRSESGLNIGFLLNEECGLGDPGFNKGNAGFTTVPCNLFINVE